MLWKHIVKDILQRHLRTIYFSCVSFFKYKNISKLMLPSSNNIELHNANSTLFSKFLLQYRPVFNLVIWSKCRFINSVKTIIYKEDKEERSVWQTETLSSLSLSSRQKQFRKLKCLTFSPWNFRCCFSRNLRPFHYILRKLINPI